MYVFVSFNYYKWKNICQETVMICIHICYAKYTIIYTNLLYKYTAYSRDKLKKLLFPLRNLRGVKIWRQY